jgi:hypothetical protein
MQQEDFPALYCAADSTSNDAQALLLKYNKISAALLVLAVMTSLESTMNSYLAIISAIFFIGSLSAYVYSKNQKFQERWYQARALAESIKTATWRVVMSAEPFGHAKEEANLEIFRSLLTELLEENKGIGAHISGDWSQKDEITIRMLEILRMPFEDKKATYLKERIDDQRAWYAKKSGDNRNDSTKYLWFVIAAYGAAIILLLIRIAISETPFLPIDVCAIIASSLISWTEIKRFDELASAYGLTAHEVGIIKSRYHSVTSIDHLSSFVSDAENAFSREHTQWAARRDH